MKNQVSGYRRGGVIVVRGLKKENVGKGAVKASP